MLTSILSHSLIDQPIGWYYALIAIYVGAGLFCLVTVLLLLASEWAGLATWGRSLFADDPGSEQ